jgi:hypothetical protein
MIVENKMVMNEGEETKCNKVVSLRYFTSLFRMLSVFDVLVSSGLGIVVTVLIVYFTSGSEAGGSEPKQVNAAVSADCKLVTDQLKKSAHLRKFFGVSDDKIDEDIQKIESITRLSAEKSFTPDEDLSVGDHFEDTVSPILSLLFYAVATTVALYLGNLATDGLLYRVLIGLFPQEAEALRLT